MQTKELERMEKEIIQKAEDAGVENFYLFKTTFERYQTLVRMCGDLEQTCEKESLMITKEYVKGRENVYVHPVIKAYNQTVSTANKTAETLTRLIACFKVEEPDAGEIDPLMEILNRK